jgi:hypothetical protein
MAASSRRPRLRTSDRTKHAVTVTRKPVINCQECTRPLVYDPGPGNASAVLTAHYNREHAGTAG